MSPARTASCLIALAALATAAEAAPLWRRLPLDHGFGRVDGLHFVDDRFGWIATGGGRVYHTEDGGTRWQIQFDDPAYYLRSIAFGSRKRGWLGTLISNSLLFQTEDGGETWKPVKLPKPEPNAICGLWAPSERVVYGVGSYTGPARLIKSADGGETWTTKDLAPLAHTLVDVYFKSETEGFVVGSVGWFPNSNRAVVLHTTDGGATWQQRFVGPRTGEWCWKITFPTPQVGYVSMEREAGPMHFLKTVDGGLTWMELPFANQNEQGIGFVTPEIGWIGGAGNPTYATTDGGSTWSQSPWGAEVNRFQFVRADLGFASGDGVYKFSDHPILDTGNPESSAPRASAAPNPFGPRTAIAFTLEREEHLRLFVCDASGRVVRTLADGPRAAGFYRVTWDGRGDRGAELPPGIYLYVLHAGERHEMGKLVRVR